MNFGGLVGAGNSSIASASLKVLFDRNRLWIDQWTLSIQGNVLYDSDAFTARFLEGTARYGFSLTPKWYGFVQTVGTHDYSTATEWRVLSHAGVGYWFFDNNILKLQLEAGAGYRAEKIISQKTAGYFTGQFRVFFEYAINRNCTGALTSILFPAFVQPGSYRWQTDLVLHRTLSGRIGIRIGLRTAYETKPAAEKKQWDRSLETALTLQF